MGTEPRPQDSVSYTSDENTEQILSSSVSSNGSLGGFSRSPSVVGSDVTGDVINGGDDVINGGDDVIRNGNETILRKKRELETAEITEEMIQFVSENPRVMRRWQNLAHHAGMSGRVPIIQARIRMEGRDHDEHVLELIREWSERNPGEATVSGLVKLLRSQNFNDTAEKIEDGSFLKKMKK